jgi:ribosomal protein L29
MGALGSEIKGMVVNKSMDLKNQTQEELVAQIHELNAKIIA